MHHIPYVIDFTFALKNYRKKDFVRIDGNALFIVFCNRRLHLDKVTSKRIYVKAARPNGIPDRQLFPHLIQLLLRLPPLPLPFPSLTPGSRTLGVLTDHLSSKHRKIIQISSLRFPSNPDERERSTRVDAQHAGLPRGLACQLTSTKTSQVINRRLLTDPEQPDKAQKNKVPKDERRVNKNLWWAIAFVNIDKKYWNNKNMCTRLLRIIDDRRETDQLILRGAWNKVYFTLLNKFDSKQSQRKREKVHRGLEFNF